MGWIIGVVAVALITATVVAFRETYERAAAFGLILLMSIVPGIVIVGAGNLISSIWVGTHYETQWTNRIAALSDTSGGGGKFFLGSGTYEEEPAFWYYVDYGDYSKLHWVYANSARIVQTDTQTPSIEKREPKSDNKWLVWDAGEPEYIFTVPEGSITNNFVLDAKP